MPVKTRSEFIIRVATIGSEEFYSSRRAPDRRRHEREISLANDAEVTCEELKSPVYVGMVLRIVAIIRIE